MREMTPEPGSLAHGLEVGGPAIGALPPVVEDAGVEDRVHPEVRERPPQPGQRRVVRVPVGRDQLSRAPQAQLVVAALGLLDHQAYRPLEVAPGEVWYRVQGAEAEQPLRGAAADVCAVVVVRA